MNSFTIKHWGSFCFIICVLAGPISIYAEEQKEEDLTVSLGKNISIEYTLKLDDDTVVDSNVGSMPLKFVHGAKSIIPGLEDALTGMKIGESKQVTITPEDGYGPVDQGGFLEISKDQVPQESLKVGEIIQGKSQDGQIMHARVSEIKEQKVVIDFNHPLAGKTLHFDVKITDIQ